MATKSITFHGQTFTTKRSATDALRSFMQTLPLHTWLLPGDDRFETLLDAFEYHPSWGDTLDAIVKLRIEPERGAGLAVVVKLDDGSTDKVGWSKSFNRESTHYSLVMAALRFEIVDQVGDYRARIEDGLIPAVSAISGEPLVLRGANKFHVDHVPAFADTAAEWLAQHGGADEIVVHDMVGGGTELKSQRLADDWYAFHNARHNHEHGLRALTRDENVKLGRHSAEVASR